LYQHEYDPTDVTEAIALREIHAIAPDWPHHAYPHVTGATTST
jgi:hypothetical protein